MVSLELPPTGYARDYVVWATGIPGNAPVAVAVMDPAEGVTRLVDTPPAPPGPGEPAPRGWAMSVEPDGPVPARPSTVVAVGLAALSDLLRPRHAVPPFVALAVPRSRSARATFARTVRRRATRLPWWPSGDHPAGGVRERGRGGGADDGGGDPRGHRPARRRGARRGVPRPPDAREQRRPPARRGLGLRVPLGRAALPRAHR